MEYYKDTYKVSIKDSNQPLIKIIVRNGDNE